MSVARVLLATIALSLASAAVATPPAIDACSLLRVADIERVIGVPVEAGQRRDAGLENNGAWSSSCLWMVQAPAGEPEAGAAGARRGFVILNAMQWPVGSGRAREFLDAFREAAEQGVLPRAPVARHFGDEALWWGDGLAVRRQDVSFGLSVHLPRAPQQVPGGLEARLAPLVLAQVDRHNAVLARNASTRR